MSALCVWLRLLIVQGDARRLDLPIWLIAFERYTLGAQAVEHQLSFQQALVHKEVVVEIACSAKSAGRSELLGVLYDELARFAPGGVRLVCSCVLLFVFFVRKKWEDLSGKLGDRFDLESATKRDAVLACLYCTFVRFC